MHVGTRFMLTLYACTSILIESFVKRLAELGERLWYLGKYNFFTQECIPVRHLLWWPPLEISTVPTTPPDPPQADSQKEHGTRQEVTHNMGLGTRQEVTLTPPCGQTDRNL